MGKKRESITKTKRFEVFKRDLFTCQYCGNSPPKIVLEIDHINPVSDGGDNSIDNLIAACFDCNRGKGARLLDTLPETLNQKMLIQQEKSEQLKQYEKLLKAEKRKLNRKIDKIENIFNSYFEDYKFTDKFRNDTGRLLKLLPLSEAEDAMELACINKYHDSGYALKYFCGVCWRKIKGDYKHG